LENFPRLEKNAEKCFSEQKVWGIKREIPGKQIGADKGNAKRNEKQNELYERENLQMVRGMKAKFRIMILAAIATILLGVGIARAVSLV